MKTRNLSTKAWLILPIGLLLLTGYRFMQLEDTSQLQTQPPMPVKVQTEQIVPELITGWSFSEGTVQAYRKAFLDFEAPGKVVTIGELENGTQLREGARVFGPDDTINRGQFLAQIDSRQNSASVKALEARLQAVRAQKQEAEARLQQAENDLALSKQNFARMEEVYERGVISQDEFERNKTALLNAQSAVAMNISGLEAIESDILSVSADINRETVSLEKTSLFAPFDGYIAAMNIREDNHYYPPAGINSNRDREASSAIVIVDDSLLEIQLELPVEDARLLKEGQTVYLASDNTTLYRAEENQFQGSNVVTGTIWSVSPTINLQRRSQSVKVRVHNDEQQLIDGEFVRAWIAATVVEDAISLPIHAISFRSGNAFAFIVNNENQVEERQLSLGLQGLRRIQVLDGLEAGDQVVTRGQHLLINGSQVEVVGVFQ
ncbi:efflux RND transporter periplasmic adaptor subunit [Photobacterium sp. BZF1]|uniref:efflux RND transporter periplasmic adaptor subunit n=1 Tax=Photobacterium sp. BZF1 TaxID=1904457 RepID=UPI0016538567|nr:efflux RND transporter periplasmic adaptor subunit [Photobacterium sp. BZF1]MBC7004106.1 efflux RND transporter periplasmic adaptor subunit [Photobacterium sp. BZF1]